MSYKNFNINYGQSALNPLQSQLSFISNSKNQKLSASATSMTTTSSKIVVTTACGLVVAAVSKNQIVS